jgi:hypothetical protein
VTIAVAVCVPPAPFAVRVYVVESAGVTLSDPLGCTATPSMLTSVALLVCQVNVVDSPLLIVPGLTESEAVGAGVGAVHAPPTSIFGGMQVTTGGFEAGTKAAPPPQLIDAVVAASRTKANADFICPELSGGVHRNRTEYMRTPMTCPFSVQRET